jgi:hypothetical protein
VLSGVWLFISIALALAVGARQNSSSDFIDTFFLVVVALLVLWAGAFAWSRTKLVPEGLVVRNLFVTRRVAREDVVSVGRVSVGTRRQPVPVPGGRPFTTNVVLLLRDGRSLRCMSLLWEPGLKSFSDGEEQLALAEADLRRHLGQLSP